MMNKKTAQTNHIKQKNMFKYELSKTKKDGPVVFFMTFALQLSFLIFFSIVGKLDNTEDTITSFSGILAISTTVSMLGVSIYAAVLLRKNLVRFYIGEQRNRIFLFPVDRKTLLKKKTASFLTIILTNYLLALVCCLGAAIFANTFLQFKHLGILHELYVGLIAALVSSLFLYAVLIFSAIIAIFKQSEIATVVTSVLLTLIMSNPTVIGLVYSPSLTLLLALLIGLLAVIVQNSFAKSLNGMEVF